MLEFGLWGMRANFKLPIQNQSKTLGILPAPMPKSKVSELLTFSSWLFLSNMGSIVNPHCRSGLDMDNDSIPILPAASQGISKAVKQKIEQAEQEVVKDESKSKKTKQKQAEQEVEVVKDESKSKKTKQKEDVVESKSKKTKQKEDEKHKVTSKQNKTEHKKV